MRIPSHLTMTGQIAGSTRETQANQDERVFRRDNQQLMGRRGFHDTVSDFERLLLEVTLAEHGGNRSRTAVTLGLERTYLLRLIKQFKVKCPPGQIGGPQKKRT